MADVKWIKITTDIFDDEKMLLIESLPDANAIIVVWFKLLCLAGKMNNSGVFMMNDRIAYTDKMLSTIFRMKESTVQLALQTFEQFGMVELIDGVITIPNWGKHQSLEQIEERKKYQREYQREYRKKQKELADSKHLHKHLRNDDVNSLEVEVKKEVETEEEKESSVVEEKLPQHTHISTSVYQDLCKKYGKAFVDERVDRAYSDKALIRFCEEDYGKPSRKPKSSGFSNQRQYDMDELEKRLIGGKPKAEDDP